MTRKKYIMSPEEMETLSSGLLSDGPDEVYVRMKAMGTFAMSKKDDVDEMFLDMSEAMLEKSREEASDEENEEGIIIKKIYYTLSFLLRRLAHEIYRKYIKNGKERSNNRFLRLVSDNEDALLMI